MKFFYRNRVKFLIFLFFQFNFVPNKALAGTLKIKYVKIENEIPIWPYYDMAKIINYSKLNSDGLPIDLEIIRDTKYISFVIETNSNLINNYRYKLSGKDINWNYGLNLKEIKYRYLEMGRYTFIIQEFNKNQIIQEKTFKFKIMPIAMDYLSTDLLFLMICIIVFEATYKVK